MRLNLPAAAFSVLAALLPAAPPPKAVVVSRYPEALKEALAQYETRSSRAPVEFRVLGEEFGCHDLDGARVIYVHGTQWTPAMRACAPLVRELVGKGALVGTLIDTLLEVNWGIRPSAPLAPAEKYLRFGGRGNLVEFFALLANLASGSSLKVNPAQPQAQAAIYHPRAPGAFLSLQEYLAWYRSSGLVQKSAPLAGITFFSANYVYGDLAHIDALIEALERRGVGAVAVYGWPLKEAEPFLVEAGKPVVDVLLCLNLLMQNPENADWLAVHELHAINLVTTTESFETWSTSRTGLPPARLPVQVGNPEKTGATEPVLIATTEKEQSEGDGRLRPVPDRIEAAAERAWRWIQLRRKNNFEKKVALIYFNNPPGKGTLGASYLNLFPSLVTLVETLEAAGYSVAGRPPSESKLKELLMASGRNVGEYAPGELATLEQSGHVTKLPLTQYRQWYDELPREFREAVEKAWGPPEQARLMTVEEKGRRAFLLPGVKCGNVFIGPQPLRASLEEAAGSAHDRNTPPPHSYIAYYLWLKREFGADAIVHLGRHGTLEWLPGKEAAQTSWDPGEVLMGNLPHAYYYVVDGGGEFLQSKRRSGAVMISHLTPLLAAAGLPAELKSLRDTLENRSRVENENPALARQYEREIIAQAKRLSLGKPVGVDLDRIPPAESIQRIEDYLHDLEAQPMPWGMHAIGTMPSRQALKEGLILFTHSAFTGADAAMAGRLAPDWAEALLEGRNLPGPAELTAKIEVEARAWLENIRQSPTRETEALVKVLAGKYLPSGVSGDPLRSAAAVPTGRNMHDIDPRTFPTKAAWAVGKRMAEDLVEKQRKETGKYPEKVSLVLWYGEATRHQGIAEAQALALLGVEPVWNARGQPDQLRLIPEEELGRPRVDVVLTMSGLYRDGMPEMLSFLDRAVRLAASAPDRNNAVRRNTEEVARRLIQGGVPFSVAQTAAAARIFGPAPGNFGVGMADMMEASRDAGNSAAAGQLYLKNMNFAYSQELVGQQVEGNLNAQLANNELVIHSRSTNLYGVLDNDDTYQFAGGLTAATRVASGQAPKLLISNVRRPGQESFEGMEKFLDRELRSRIWNPKWIEGMKASGYAGAREIAKSIEHLYGLRSTAPEAVDPSVWKETLEVYVKDKYRLGLDQYFRAANPHAAQMVAARLLEVDRQGVYRFSPEDKRALLRSYVQSINRAGVSCYVNVCDNQRLRQYVATAARTSQAVSAEALAVMEARMQIASGQVPNPAPGPALRPERRTALPRSLSLLDKVRLVDAASFVRRLRRPESFTDWFLLTLLCTTLGTGTLAGVVRTRFTPPPLTTFGATLEATPESLDRPEAGWPIQSRLPSSGLPD